MCLSTISKRKPKSSGVGYKVFQRGVTVLGSGNREFLASPIYGNVEYKRGIWYEANGRWAGGYFAGFHIFKNRSQAKKHWAFEHHRGSRVILKVRYSGATVQGIDGFARTVVAKRMYIYKKDRS